MSTEMSIRIAIAVDEQLDSQLLAYAALEYGNASHATLDRIGEAALSQLLVEEPNIRMSEPLREEDWELETPVGRFRIRDGRAETLPSKLPADSIVETLLAMYKEAEDANKLAKHYPRR